jgi:hypothetical protein
MPPQTDTTTRWDLEADEVFDQLVHLTNTTDLEIAITLHVRGLVVTGRLISGETYWRETAAELLEGAEDGPDLARQALAESMEGIADQYRDAEGDPRRDDAPGPRSTFLHLRDARTLTPGGPVPTDGALWRGRVASVDGFKLGMLRSRN